MKINLSVCLFLIGIFIPIKSFGDLGDIASITTPSGALEIAQEEVIEEQEAIEEEE